MRDASVFTWSFILSRTSGQKENRKSSRMRGKVLPPNPDKSADFEGANDYAIGPPCCELRVITKQQRKNYGTARQDRVEARPNHCSFDEHVERTGKRGLNQTYAPCHWGGPPHILG